MHRPLDPQQQTQGRSVEHMVRRGGRRQTPVPLLTAVMALVWASSCDQRVTQVDTEADGGLSAPGDRERPKRVQAVSISVGTEHACAVTDRGRLMCWGRGAEVGRLDGASGRVETASVGDKATGILFADGDIGQHPARALEASEYPYPAGSVPQSALGGGRRIVQFEAAHGLDQSGCTLSASGSVACQYFRRPTTAYDDSYQPVRPLSFLDGTFEALSNRRWQWLSPHAGWVGCGLDTDDRYRCWTGGITQEIPDPEDGETDRFGTFRGDERLMPAEVVQVCASPAQVCGSQANGDVRCWSTTRPGWHKLEDEPSLEFNLGEVIQIACGALTGPGFYDEPFFGPPNFARVCVLDGEGAVTCVGDDGAPERIFAGTTMAAIDTNGAATCGITRRGKVVCVVHEVDSLQDQIANVPRGLRP